MNEVNSKSYWDTRFSDNWDSCDGPAQSCFFAKLAAENMPQWLWSSIRRENLFLADWGCAEGDGTALLASYLGLKRVIGIDFSTKAIEIAAKRYPATHFAVEDWLANRSENNNVYDVIFSSNTLEHFHSPFDVLDRVSARASKAIALALPYCEADRIAEHFYSFFPNNIPTRLENGFRLVWSSVVDCRSIDKTYWPGSQIFLVYANLSWLDSLGLRLSDCFVSSDSWEQNATLLSERDGQIASLNQAVAERDGQIASLNQAVAERDGQIASLNQAVAERDGQIASLSEAVTVRDGQIDSLEAEISALNLKLIQISNWATYIDAHPVTHSFKKAVLGVARGTLRAAPVSMATKQRLRDAFFTLIRPLRQSIRSKAVSLRLSHSAMPPMAQMSYTRSVRDVFVFAVIDWHFRIQRPQHIARSLAEGGRRVFYFSNHFVDADLPGYQLERLPGANDLYQVKLHVMGAPAIYFDPPSDVASEMLARSMSQFIQDFGALSSLSIVQHAYWYPLVRRLPNSYRIYDCMDHHEGFGNVPAKIVEIEKEMLRSADLVTVTSSWLEDFAHKYNPSVALVRNAAEYTHFVTRPEQVYTDAKGRRIIGYYGAIAEWFDLEHVRAIALAQPDCLILLVGNDTIGAQKVLADLPNVEFTGEVPYTTLPYYLHAFAVCLLPFKVIPLTLATNPVKVYEYLSAGKPVVCVDLPEVGQFGDLVARTGSIDAFITEVGAALRESGPEAERRSADRRRFASEQTWCHRGEELATALKSVRMPRVSVVILTFNNLDLTRACLDSVFERSDYANLEVIVVDNASSDGTPAYLEDFARLHTNMRVVLNSENLGFAAGNNIGLTISTGDYLVVLNNDTVVTQGWVMTMLRHFQAFPGLGLLGPVTNNIGNEARIEISYPDIVGMSAEAFGYTLAHMGQLYPMRSVAFFCVMMPRSTYERCGPISEDYGLGFFEDDDYCRKVEAAGLAIACAEDVFVHHHLSASFNKMKDSERFALFERNKTIYEQKWGAWKPHRYRP